MSMPVKSSQIAKGCLGAVLVFPWINPIVFGPSPNVGVWLVSVLCLAMLCLCIGRLSVAMVASFWLLAAVLSVCMGVTQYFGWAHDLTPWVHATNVGEAFSNLRQRNQYASLLSIGLLALLYLIRQQKTITRPYRVGQIRWYFLLVGGAGLWGGYQQLAYRHVAVVSCYGLDLVEVYAGPAPSCSNFRSCHVSICVLHMGSAKSSRMDGRRTIRQRSEPIE